ncbi:MAG: hypothetical protein K8S97_09620 [Anaerolineae bacterium]|nr:hypothetical protein [Anaerolineae bacterium]
MKWLSDDFALTKRQCGMVLIAVGLLLAVGMLAMELVQGAVGGFGAIQQMGVAGGLLSVVLGVTLLPLGDQPA